MATSLQMSKTRKEIPSSSSTTNFVDNEDISLEDAAKDDKVFSDDLTLAWGWNTFKPKWLQWLNSPKWCLFFICCFSTLQGMAVNTFVNLSLPTLEKRFKLSSKQTGFIVAANDIPAVILTLFVGFFGGYGHKTKWLGYGGILTGVSALVFAFPKLIIGKYNPALLSSASTTLCKASNATLSSTECNTDTDDFNFNFFMFVLAQLLAGAGSTPLFSLGPAYLDENVHPKHMSAYLGFFYLSSLLGPGMGSIIGGQLLSIYVDFVMPAGLSLTPKDYGWIGAWWLGPTACGVILILDGIILMGFPRKLPGSDAMRKEALAKGYIKKDKIATSGFRNFWPHFKALLTNWTYMFQNFAFLSGTIIGFGIGPFMFKFLIGRYGASPFEAGVGITVLLLPSTALGICIGSIIVRKLGARDSCRRAAKAAFLLQLVGIWGAPIFLTPGCDYARYAGSDVGYVNRSLVKLADHCNKDCRCSPSLFRPLCGPNGNSYFSPCFAGCTHHIPNKGYTNCSCVSRFLNKTSMTENHAILTEGACHQHCPRLNLYGFILGSFLVITVGFLNVIPSKTVTLRCVSESQRSLALAMQFLFLRLLSGIPSPVLVGAMIDATCTLWNTKCNVNQNCLNYDYDKLGKIIVAMGAPSTFLSLIFFGLSWYCSKDTAESTTTADKAGIDNEGADLNDNLELDKLNDRRPRSEPIVTSF